MPIHMFSPKHQYQQGDTLPEKIIMVVSHERSGTHLSIDLLRKQFSECKARMSFLETRHHSYLTLEHLSPKPRPYISHIKALEILNKSKIPIVKAHCLPGFESLGSENADFVSQIAERSQIYYIVRDGRRVLCSYYLFSLKTVYLDTRWTISEFMRQEHNGVSHLKWWANHVRYWIDQENVKVIKYEDIIHNPEQVINSIADDCKLSPLFVEPLLPKKVAPRNRWEDYWLRLTRQYESTAIDTKHSKNRQPWQTLFSQEDRIFFHQEAGDILIRLGYEKDSSWTMYN